MQLLKSQIVRVTDNIFLLFSHGNFSVSEKKTGEMVACIAQHRRTHRLTIKHTHSSVHKMERLISMIEIAQSGVWGFWHWCLIDNVIRLLMTFKFLHMCTAQQQQKLRWIEWKVTKSITRN